MEHLVTLWTGNSTVFTFSQESLGTVWHPEITSLIAIVFILELAFLSSLKVVQFITLRPEAVVALGLEEFLRTSSGTAAAAYSFKSFRALLVDHGWGQFFTISLSMERLTSFDRRFLIKLTSTQSNSIFLRQVIEVVEGIVDVIHLSDFGEKPSLLVTQYLCPVLSQISDHSVLTSESSHSNVEPEKLHFSSPSSTMISMSVISDSDVSSSVVPVSVEPVSMSVHVTVISMAVVSVSQVVS